MRFDRIHSANPSLSWLTIAIVSIAACAHSAGVCWPFGIIFQQGSTLWWLQLASLAVLCWQLSRAASARQAAAIGLVFATVWLSATFWWLYIAMHTYGDLNSLITVVAIVALAAALGVYYAAACAAFWRFSDTSPWLASLVFAAAWTGAEMARGTWLTGFGWGAVGYAHVDGPLAAYIPWLGAYGVGALAAWLAATLATTVAAAVASIAPTTKEFFGSKTPGSWAGPAATAAIILAVGAWAPQGLRQWSTTTGTLSVTLLQGNIPQDEKFQPGTGVRDALLWYGAQLQRSTSQLVVTPETAIPLLPQQLPDGYWEALQQHFSTGKQAAMVGIPLGSYSQGYTNSVVSLSATSVAAPGVNPVLAPEPLRYDKHHLVPFGEFIPPMFRWFTRLMNIPLGDFNRGAVGQPSLAWQGQLLAPNICYEDLFGEELGARFVDPALAPTIFVNVSNIGWFGNTVAIDQHLNISRMRALEFERPFVRATNTGATAILDHRAHVVAQLPRLTRGVLDGVVEGRTGTTPFAWWVSRFGLWPLWLAVIGILAFAWRRRGP